MGLRMRPRVPREASQASNRPRASGSDARQAGEDGADVLTRGTAAMTPLPLAPVGARSAQPPACRSRPRGSANRDDWHPGGAEAEMDDAYKRERSM